MSVVYAHTEHALTPAFINLSETSPGTVKLTVRSRGKDGYTGDVGAIDLTNAELHDLVASAIRYLNQTNK